MKKIFILTIFFSMRVLAAPKECAINIDKLQLFYINGMFTNFQAFIENKDAINRMQIDHLNKHYPSSTVGVEGFWNRNEITSLQIAEVARQKAEDRAESTNISDLIFEAISAMKC